MAQATRLNLRMQKELKLLLTDPPPGVSFPLLSAHSDLFSLSTIDAQIEGPEATVYANGIFNIRIQIPERYPFQPPSVTFATPIYHPNIDNGGRICLDILNLPPKGAWQPSLNISTVLTSIGLLLSEPNPDDGLMCEASRECKYNRQAFDQKARSMTEKYAMAGAGGISFRSQCPQTHSNPSMMEVNRVDDQAHGVINDPDSSAKEPYEVSQDLLFDSQTLNQRRGRENDEERVVFDYPPSYSQQHMEIEGKRKELKEAIPEYNLDHKKPLLSKLNLSLHSSAPCCKRECDKEKEMLHQPPPCTLNLTSLASFASSNRHKQLHCEHQTDGLTYQKRMSSGKLSQVDKKQFTGSVDSCQTGDGNNEKMIDALQSSPPLSSSPSPSHFRESGGGLPAAISIKHDVLCPIDTTIDRTVSNSFNKNFPGMCPVSKRLSLGLKSSSARPDNDDRENVVPILKWLAPNLQTVPTKSSNGRKLSLGSLTPLQESDSHNILQVSCSPNCMDPSNSLSMQHHRWLDGKEQSNLNNGKTDGVIQQGMEESPTTRELIVVDSEDSEEDVKGSSRLRLSLGRKRMGKRRA